MSGAIHLSGEGRLRAAITKIHVAAKTATPSARSRRGLCAGRFGRSCPESRSGQIGDAVVCGQLRDLSSQRARSRQRALPYSAIPVPAGALRDQFEHGRGTGFLSGLGRRPTKRPIAGDRDKAAAFRGTPTAQTGAVLVIVLRSSRNYRSPRRINNAASLRFARPPWRPSGSGPRQDA
jgi:hypothetical protein